MMLIRASDVLILFLNLSFRSVLTTKNVNKCPTFGCVSRETLVTSDAKVNYYFLSDDPSQGQTSSSEDKPNILSQIKEASSKKITESSTTRLSSSFSQGYIDLGSRDPREEGAATLAFVFDTTGSMYDDLRQVIDGAGKILKTVLEKFERPINDYVLVPFNDPDIGKMTVTSDPEEFKESLHELQYYIQGGGDCPEMAVGAIKMALEVCLPSSYIYVFTDARAKDYYLLDDVLRLIQKKHTQVVFVMTGDCGNKTHPGYQAFETIASTSSGQVFHLNKSDVDEVLNFVRLSLESRKVNLLSVDRKSEEPGEENLQLLVDKTLREFTISVSGQKPKIEIRYYMCASYHISVHISRCKIKGRYNISVGSESKYTVRATGLSSIDFQTGFSLKPTTNFKETYHRPMKGGVSNVLVKPLDETEFGDLFRLQLISLDGKVLENIPLERLPGHDTLFKGTSVEAPEEPFNIKVFGRDKEGFEFERISPTAVSSQLPFPPEVIAKETEEGYYDRSAVITCHIQTLVPFNVTWKKNGKYIAGPYRYPQSAEIRHIIERPTSRDEGIYTCLASNIAGSSFANVFLDIKEPPPEVYVFGNASLTPGLSGILRCDVTSTVEFNVTWSRYKIRGQVRDFFGRLETGGSKAKEIYLEVQSLPEVSVSPISGTFKAGENLTLTCNAANVFAVQTEVLAESGSTVSIKKATLQCYGQGIPPPTIRWFKEDSSEVLPLSFIEIKDGYLRISGVQASDGGTYTCVASNGVGTAEDQVTLSIGSAPSILQAPTDNTIEVGATGGLSCYGIGIPQPTITWHREGEDSLPPHFTQDKSGALRVNGMRIEDEGVYVCVLENQYGRKEIKSRLSVSGLRKLHTHNQFLEFIYIYLVPPLIAAPPNPHIRTVSSDSVTLPCTVVMATPSPTINWYFEEKLVELKEGMFVTREGDLRIPFAKPYHEGRYRCEATNVAGNSSLDLYLNVLVKNFKLEPPRLREGRQQEEVRPLHGDRVRLKCPVGGDPTPTYSWQKNGELVQPFQRRIRIGSDGTMLIREVKDTDSGVYVCTAINAAGAINTAVTLTVLVPPKIAKDPETYTIAEGEIIDLPCRSSGSPSPSVTWRRRTPNQPKLMNTTSPSGSLRQHQISCEKRIEGGIDNEGIYECTATNEAGETQRIVKLIVNKVPEIYPTGDLSLSVVAGEDLKLPCESRHPTPKVAWTKDEEDIQYSEFIQ
ncbi:Hemicentin-1 [Armadillidium vulgare]|nr:Hemicentin-1 [Armadillidium vulgare]